MCVRCLCEGEWWSRWPRTCDCHILVLARRRQARDRWLGDNWREESTCLDCRMQGHYQLFVMARGGVRARNRTELGSSGERWLGMYEAHISADGRE